MPLAPGLYEHLLTRRLSRALESLAPLRADLQEVPSADQAAHLARHLTPHLQRAFAALDDDEARLALAERLLAVASESVPDLGVTDETPAPPARLLSSVYQASPPRRPSTPLGTSTLLTRNRVEPALSHELGCEIESADRVDIVAAFITLRGVGAVAAALEGLARRGGRLRVLTTVFTGTTEVEALDALARLPHAEVKVSYDTRRTRLHAKAWLFERRTGLHSAYIGSANLTATALGSGHEWMVKVCAGDLPQVIDKFSGTFEGLWNDAEFEAYNPNDELQRQRLRRALKAERSQDGSVFVALFTLRPFPYQEQILDRLEVEREVHGRRKNLVIAATGTGKTVIAALDYGRLAERAGVAPRLLFVAHRREILEQALATFRSVRRDGAFGELLLDGEVPERWDHLFATVQTASRVLPQRVAADHFVHVVIDECHHAPAESYQRLISFLRPHTLLGLTATPERVDGKSLLDDFDGTVATELRLWHALERQLLVPFEYYGIADGTDLSRVRWTRSGYAQDELAQLYTGNDARVDLIVEQLRRRVVDPRAIRALAFCVSVEHAVYMARALTARGVPAVAVHGGTSAEERRDAPRRLRERDVNVLCTCDLYNEGVDLPFVDTLLFLRPTASATIFLQQLGRGLRLAERKQSCLVLDFIGQHRADFRFDEVYGAITSVPRGKLVEAVAAGFPYLPSGCVLDLDAVARERVLASLRSVLPNVDRLAREVRELAQENPALTLSGFLKATGRDVEDVYRNQSSWTALLVRAGQREPLDDETADMSRRLGTLVHVDERARLEAWRTAVRGDEGALTDESYRRRLTMFEHQTHHRGVLREPIDTVRYLSGNAAIRREIEELADALDDKVDVSAAILPVPDWPLALHQRYSRREIVAAIGFVLPGAKARIPQGGILKLEEEKRELLFVTLDKSGKSFSPNTRYRDYAISAGLFHWESQATAAPTSAAGRRYLESPGNGWRFYLFVRESPESVEEYAFLGEVHLRASSGERPMGITWALAHAMPAGLFERFATLAQG